MHFKLFKQTIHQSFFLIIAYLLMMILLLNLGFWQLNRADEKREFLQRQQKQLKSVLNLTTETDDNLDALRYQPVRIEGVYDTSKQFLIDNQIVKGKAGYFIMTPFVLKGGTKAVLINRGWLPANPDRSILPNIDLIKNTYALKGRINNFPSVGLKLKGAEIPSKGWPSVLQIAESNILAQKLGYELFSFQVELDPTETQGYSRYWLEKTIMPPEKHIGYAVQWFGLAMTLTFLFFWHSRKTRIND
ncbi:MAG: SURF1 family protein [Methylococcales bacterium]|nr:SURF1 family protein [Methylococcales bacterium]